MAYFLPEAPAEMLEIFDEVTGKNFEPFLTLSLFHRLQKKLYSPCIQTILGLSLIFMSGYQTFHLLKTSDH